MIMSLCKKGLHSFLGFANLVDSPPPPPPPPFKAQVSVPGFGLGTATDDSHHHGPNVVKSTAMFGPALPAKNDLAGLGSVDEVGGGSVVDGLMSCTESLGFESSDSLLPDEWYPTRLAKPVERTTWREAVERRREKKYPPPISSLNHKGQRSFFFRPVRTEGRLALEEVRIDRPEILRASREEGRLRLDLIVDGEASEAEPREEKEEEFSIGKEGVVEVEGDEQEELQKVEEDQDDIVEWFQDENPGSGEWKIPMSSDGFGAARCYDALKHRSHHHHHNFHDVWRQPCVPTR